MKKTTAAKQAAKGFCFFVVPFDCGFCRRLHTLLQRQVRLHSVLPRHAWEWTPLLRTTTDDGFLTGRGLFSPCMEKPQRIRDGREGSRRRCKGFIRRGHLRGLGKEVVCPLRLQGRFYCLYEAVGRSRFSELPYFWNSIWEEKEYDQSVAAIARSFKSGELGVWPSRPFLNSSFE